MPLIASGVNCLVRRTVVRNREPFQSGQVVADVAGGDPDEREQAIGVITPIQETAHGVGVVLAGMGVGELALEELVPGELGSGACGGDDRRRPEVVVGPAAPGGHSVVTRVEDDLGRIAHFWMGPLLRSLW